MVRLLRDGCAGHWAARGSVLQGGEDHKKNMKGGVEALQKLREEGWKLKHECIEIRDLQFHCSVCDRKGAWYEVFYNHIGTKKHLKALCGHGFSPAPAEPTPEEQRPWDELLSAYVDGVSAEPVPWSAPLQLSERPAPAPSPEASAQLRVVLLSSKEAARDTVQGQRLDPIPRNKTCDRSKRSRSRRREHREDRHSRRKDTSSSRQRRRRKSVQVDKTDNPSAGSRVPAEQPTGPEFVELDVKEVRFTHDSIASTFADGKSLAGLVSDLQAGKVHPATSEFLRLEAVCAEVDGARTYFSLNNRRLHCLKEFSEQSRSLVKVRLKVKKMTPEHEKIMAGMMKDTIFQRVIRAVSTSNKGESVQIRGNNGKAPGKHEKAKGKHAWH
eukprot:gb/GFBE01034386.1/.p1 GENE.gb/GFBE01034386.1/~~gb/GFBE01034386.1/.p1  ORF type:complete len:384 (+),score=53.53 gb/GFBE01034386.1/:1-1152(+)